MILEGYNFESFTSKKGKRMLIGELADYVQDQIDNQACEENSKHYICECPYCKNAYKTDASYDGQYLKHKLYVKKDLSSGWCFRCDQGFLNLSDRANLQLATPEPPITMQDFELVTLPKEGNGWTIERFWDFDDFDEEGFHYLYHDRHKFLHSLAGPLKIRYMNHNPVVPFYFHGELIYYQVKFAFGKHSIKYFSPPIQRKPPYIIEHGKNKKFIICEGTFDAISLLVQAPDYTPMAVLGSSITDYQITMLRTYMPEKILVYMDKTELSLGVKERLKRYFNYAEIDIIPSTGMDPEEKLKYKIAEEQPLKWIK